MGGLGSGRQGWRVTSEATNSFVLCASLLTKIRLKPNQHATGTFYFGEERFAVKLSIDTRDLHAPFIELRHETRDWRREDEVRYRVGLVTTVPPLGGKRWWFRCPRSGRRVAKLFLPLGGWYFWSRGAYKLAHASQRETRRDRLYRKMHKLSRRLGGEGGGDIPPKPKWMRWATYERRVDQLIEVHEAADVELARFLGRRFGIAIDGAG